MVLETPKVSFVVTLQCNLKCKLCAAHAPYYKQGYHPTVETLCLQIDRFFELVSFAGYFTLSGGEPFLRKDLDVLVRHLNQYSKQIGTLELLTNGSILPCDNVLSAFVEYNGSTRFIIDHYGQSLSINAEKLGVLLSQSLPEAMIEFHDYFSANMHCGGWVDYGVGKLPAKSTESACERFKSCAVPQKLKCLSYIDGVTYLCSQARRCIELGLTVFDAQECVDLFDRDYTDYEIQSRIKNQYQLNMLQACRFCDGLCDDSRRFTPAEQL